MTKHELVEHTGKSFRQIWLEMAMHYFDLDDPQIAFDVADKFIEELAKRQFPVRADD